MSERADLEPQTSRVYDIDYSTEHAIPLVEVPRGPDNIPESGWVVTGEIRDEEGSEFYKTARLDFETVEGKLKRFTKKVPKDVLEALNETLVERAGRSATPIDVGSRALTASEIPQPENKPMLDAIARELDVMKEDLCEADKVALWRFATARHEHEESAALAAMSEKLKQDSRLRYGYRDLHLRLSELRRAE